MKTKYASEELCKKAFIKIKREITMLTVFIIILGCVELYIMWR